MSERDRRERLRSPEQRVGTLTNGALPPPSDEELLWRALIDGEAPALERALARLTPSMMRLAMYHVRSRADAEDVVQETWLGALRGIERFEHRSSLRTWLFRILKNRARTRGARLARMVTFTDLEAAAPVGRNLRDFTVDGAADIHRLPGPERDLIARELGRRIQRAIATLPARQREVVTMRDVEGRSAREVRELLGLTDANQRVLLHRARARIRDQLSDDDGGRIFLTCCLLASPGVRLASGRDPSGRRRGNSMAGARLRARRAVPVGRGPALAPERRASPGNQ